MNIKTFSLRKTVLLLTFFAVFFSTSIIAQIKSFPGAEGAGGFTTGGRGTAAVPTTVYEVTNLNDDTSPGSLRYAVYTGTATYRTVVFRVSGTIHLTSKLSIKGNTTIAGQTAPGGGICLADYPVSIGGDNVIIRYIKCRMGDRFQGLLGKVNGSGGDDALGDLGHKNIIIDHCSVSWSTDEALTVYRGDSVTLQWNLISEPLDYSYHFETGDVDFEHHAYGGIWGGRKASFHHNLFANMKSRAPRFSGTYNGVSDTCDFRNNVIYNWGINNVYGGEGGHYNVVGNYYKQGPSTTSRTQQIVCVDRASTADPYAKYYLTGNYMTGSPTFTASNWKSASMTGGTLADTALSKMLTPFNLPALASETAATQAYIDVLAGAGAKLPTRDTLDQRIINNVKNGTGKLIDVQGGFPHGTAYALTVNAWPTLVSTTAPVDTDHDGMPDAYETANGLNPNSATDRNTRNSSGYTALEVYINSIIADTGTSTTPPTNPNPTVQTDVTATWPLSSSQIATTAGNITATNQELGSAISGTSYNSAYGAAPVSDHNAFYQRVGTTSYLTSAADLTNGYVQYTVSPISGKDLKIAKISLAALGGGTSSVGVVAKYSLDGFVTSSYLPVSATYNLLTFAASVANPVTLLNGSSTSVDFAGKETLTFDGLSILVANGKTFSLRIYPYATAASKYLANKDVTITGVTGDAGTLPLNFLSFSGKADALGKEVDLNWSTTNEVNTKNFEVQRKISDGDFVPIGTLASKNTAGVHHYSFTDQNAVYGVAYYRILQSDNDGLSKLSNVIAVSNKVASTLLVYPNPVEQTLNINHASAVAGANLKVLSLDGKTIFQKEVTINSSVSSLDVSKLATGTYLLILDNNNEKSSIKFIKQ